MVDHNHADLYLPSIIYHKVCISPTFGGMPVIIPFTMPNSTTGWGLLTS
jgi:hypothetical protein